MKKITLFTLLLMGVHSFAQIINTAPYILTVDQLKQWTVTGATASNDLICTVPLRARFTSTATQFNPASSNNMQIAYLPDGMNNFGNYYGEQSQFNLFNFTHWAYIDKLVWFGGTASQTIQIPSSPWANAAHKNGVKILGNVFFSPTAFGGTTATLTNFLEQDVDGNFIAIPKMIAIMQHYNFDGWFVNQETATNSATAALMYSFVKELTAQAEALGKEVMWYDAMLLSGSVGWQNRLNVNNSVFVQRDENADATFETRVSSNIFINFAWSGNVIPNSSRTRATTIGRSSYDVFTGVDIWPGRNQGNFETSGNTFMTSLHENAATPYTSLGIFAPNCVYNSSVYTNFNNDPTDFASFYNAENHLFSGDDNNPATVDATGFKGLANWIPETSSITQLPFDTDLCTGHGTKKFNLGAQTSTSSWHDMNKQAILPTWQWAFSESNTLTANWDFNDAISNGNSLKITGNLPANHPIDLMLYKTKLSITQGIFTTGIFYKASTATPNMKLVVVFSDDVNQKHEFPFDASTNVFGNWKYGEIALPVAFSSREIAMIGLRFESEEALAGYSMNIGRITIMNGVLGTANPGKNNSFVTASYPVGNNAPILFTINWPNAKQLNYTLYDLQGKALRSNSIKLNDSTNYPLDTNGLASGTYTIKFTDQKNVSETQKIIIR
ncbi:MAG TPA: T9SS type A sorting domain-containing protein [Flavobacterium sp.]|nr:T9SS type A sorting domain-containing protein [Flavobacterium sp.]